MATSLDLLRRSADTRAGEAAPVHALEVAKLIDISRCIGCKACQAACQEWNELRTPVGNVVDSYQNPGDLSADNWTLMRFSETDANGRLEWLIRKDGCMHCAEPGCLTACPAPGAILQYRNGIVDFQHDQCIGCGYCVAGCPFNIPRLSEHDGKAYKCTLCSDRVAVGLEPACIKSCPTGALQFGSKTDLLDYARERVTDLQERGFAQAGIYNPAGVGGTHVMYVLQHADQPTLYSGLPANPHIATAVSLWKGLFKPVATLALLFTALASFFHMVSVGPNTVDEDQEPNA